MMATTKHSEPPRKSSLIADSQKKKKDLRAPNFFFYLQLTRIQIYMQNRGGSMLVVIASVKLRGD
jgi:hypothetical protein